MAPGAGAADSADDQIVVTATRRAEPAAAVPAAIGVIDGTAIADGRLQVNLSESVASVPGLVALNRQNYAQDLAISIRGFGARASFGVRGIRLFEDGIPATMPDGQGQISHFDLPSTERIEVLRGPFSVLQGNASGGVIALYTKDGEPGVDLKIGADGGSFGTRHAYTVLSGAEGDFAYTLGLQEFALDGYRDHSAAERRNGNVKLHIDLGVDGVLTILGNATNTPSAEDPLGLTRAQWQQNPTLAGAGAIAFDTRKSIDQEQGGLVYELALDERNTVHALVYGGHRQTVQYQSIPVSTELAPASPGGVVDLARGYYGTDVNWRWHLSGIDVTVGVSADELDEARRGEQNFLGATLGVTGPIRRNEDNVAADFDQYLEATIEPWPDWRLTGGLRHSTVRIGSHDHYIVPGNGDDSGGVRYEALTPAAGLVWRPDPDWHLYLAYGEGFETPSLNELAYRSVNGTTTGLNLGLPPSRSQHFEAGAKLRLGERTSLDLAGFHVTTRDELAVAANSFGRSVYQDAGPTTRDGAELALTQALPANFAVEAAYSYLKATYGAGFTSCSTLPCRPVRIPAGNRLPGIPRDELHAELSWHAADGGLTSAVEATWRSRLYVNDANSDAAPAALLVAWRVGLEQGAGPGWHFREFLRIDNLTDARAIGSVIVNDSNGRYFEPTPPRAAYAGVAVEYKL